MKKLIGAAIFGQSGGPSSVINSSLAGVYCRAKALGADKVYGMRNGIQGFLEDRVADLDEILSDDYKVELLKKTPASFLGSCRFKLPDAALRMHRDWSGKFCPHRILEENSWADFRDTVAGLAATAAARKLAERF